VPNPLHRDVIDDIGNVVARAQSAEDAGEGERAPSRLPNLSILTDWKDLAWRMHESG